MARATKLKRVNGKLVSAKSKTGNPECSAAMSAWVKSRKSGNTPASVFAILGKCRAQARQNRKAELAQASGKLAEGRGTWQRSEKAKQLLADRAKAKRTSTPKASKSKVTRFGLKQESATGKKAFRPENLGPGQTGTMFDMKRGDLPGQTSIFDKVKTVHTHENTTPPLPVFAARAESAAQAVPKSKRVGDLVWVHHAHEQYERQHGKIPLAKFKEMLVESSNKRHLDLSRADMVEAFKPADINAAKIEHMKTSFHFVRPRAQAPARKHNITPPPISGGAVGTTREPSLRERASMRRMAKDFTGETRKRAASKLRKQREKLQRDPGSHTDHQPGSVVNLKTDLIDFDPDRFQYKMGQTDLKTGSVGSLAGVKRFDPELAGTVQVWKDPSNGKTYVVNGHNRLDLAKRLGADRISVRYLDAADASQARAKGAITNIAEGRGTSLDAAKFFRETGQTRELLESRGVPLREKIATDGLALSQLDGQIFRRVIDGHIPLERAAIIGGAGLPHEQQRALVDLVDKLPRNREVNNATLRELTDTVKAAGSKSTSTKSLFGDDTEDHSLAIYRAQLQGQIKQRLAREKKLFGTVARSRAAEDLARAGNQINTHESGKISQEAAVALGGFDALKNRSGAVSRALNEASERIHGGENARKVTDETYRRILKELPEMLAGGSGLTG